MKPVAVVLAALIAPGSLAAHAAEPSPVHLRYENPDKFVDVGMRRSEPPRMRAGVLEQLRRVVERDSAARIPQGTRLEITITQLDMAGGFRSATPGGDDVRVVTDNTPPRIDLRFVLRDPEGKVLREGTRELRNQQFLLDALPGSSPLQHERNLIEDWLVREFAQGR